MVEREAEPEILFSSLLPLHSEIVCVGLSHSETLRGLLICCEAG
jgi:hypothetical protein